MKKFIAVIVTFDVLHFDARSSRELGGRYAELMIKLERRKSK